MKKNVPTPEHYGWKENRVIVTEEKFGKRYAQITFVNDCFGTTT